MKWLKEFWRENRMYWRASWRALWKRRCLVCGEVMYRPSNVLDRWRCQGCGFQMSLVGSREQLAVYKKEGNYWPLMPEGYLYVAAWEEEE